MAGDEEALSKEDKRKLWQRLQTAMQDFWDLIP